MGHLDGHLFSLDPPGGTWDGAGTLRYRNCRGSDLQLGGRVSGDRPPGCEGPGVEPQGARWVDQRLWGPRGSGTKISEAIRSGITGITIFHLAAILSTTNPY